MKILLISYYFPPVNSIASLRTGKMVKYLKQMGHQVKVVCALDHSHSLDLATDCSENEVLYFEIEKYESKNSLLSFLRRLHKSPYLLKNMYLMGDSAIKRWGGDVILASSPPPHSLIAAMLLSKRHRVPWVADIRDLWVDHYVLQKSSVRKFFEGYVEKAVLNSAAGVVTISDPLRTILRQKCAKPVEVVYNGFDQDDYNLAPTSAQVSDKVLITYTGTIYSRNQKLEPLFQALEQLGEDRFKFQVEIYTKNGDEVRHLLQCFALEGVVFVKEPIPYQDIVSVQMNSDLLLLLLWKQDKEMGVYPGKFFEYLGAKRPILAIGHPACELGQLISERHAGFASENPTEIAKQLMLWQDIKKTKSAIPSLDPMVGRGFTREEQAAVLGCFLEDVLVCKA